MESKPLFRLPLLDLGKEELNGMRAPDMEVMNHVNLLYNYILAIPLCLRVLPSQE